jgi:hypothetical protein
MGIFHGDCSCAYQHPWILGGARLAALAASRRPGPSKDKTPAMWSAITTGRRSRMFISRMSLAGDRRPSCSLRTIERLATHSRFQRVLRGGRRDRIPRGLPARLRGYRFKAAWLALSFGSGPALGEGEKSEGAGGEPRGRGGLGVAVVSEFVSRSSFSNFLSSRTLRQTPTLCQIATIAMMHSPRTHRARTTVKNRTRNAIQRI